MEIDYGKLLAAVSTDAEHCPFPGDKGYLNRTTGEIVFLTQGGRDVEGWYGKDVAVDMVFGRADIEARPGDWIEIPKHKGDVRTQEVEEAEERFALDFLAKCGLGEYTVK